MGREYVPRRDPRGLRGRSPFRCPFAAVGGLLDWCPVTEAQLRVAGGLVGSEQDPLWASPIPDAAPIPLQGRRLGRPWPHLSSRGSFLTCWVLGPLEFTQAVPSCYTFKTKNTFLATDGRLGVGGVWGRRRIWGSREQNCPRNELCLVPAQLAHSPAHTWRAELRSLRLQGNRCRQENPYLFYKERIKAKCRSLNIIVHDVAFFC